MNRRIGDASSRSCWHDNGFLSLLRPTATATTATTAATARGRTGVRIIGGVVFETNREFDILRGRGSTARVDEDHGPVNEDARRTHLNKIGPAFQAYFGARLDQDGHTCFDTEYLLRRRF